MKTEANDSVQPQMQSNIVGGSVIDQYTIGGLTKREHMAIEFTKALLSNPSICTPHSDFEVISEKALMMVNRTIEALNTPITDKEEGR